MSLTCWFTACFFFFFYSHLCPLPAELQPSSSSSTHTTVPYQLFFFPHTHAHSLTCVPSQLSYNFLLHHHHLCPLPADTHLCPLPAELQHFSPHTPTHKPLSLTSWATAFFFATLGTRIAHTLTDTPVSLTSWAKASGREHRLLLLLLVALHWELKLHTPVSFTNSDTSWGWEHCLLFASSIKCLCP